MTTENKLTPKAAALAALEDIWRECVRDEGLRQPVVAALISVAKTRMEAVQELVRPRRKKAKEDH